MSEWLIFIPPIIDNKGDSGWRRSYLKVDFIINSHPEVTSIAMLEDDRLMELIVEGGDEILDPVGERLWVEPGGEQHPAKLLPQGNGGFRLKPTLTAGQISLADMDMTGRVVDQATGAPIPNGTVVVLVEQGMTVTPTLRVNLK